MITFCSTFKFGLCSWEIFLIENEIVMLDEIYNIVENKFST